MENRDENKGIEFFSIILFVALICGIIVMFSKTADLMSAFAPQSIAGYTGIESFYGIAVALLVDGTVAAMKLKMLFMGRAKNQIEWAWDIVLTLIPFLISAFAQAIDSFMVRDTLKSQPPEIQFLVNWGVPAIPALVVGLILIYGFINSAPDGMFAGVSNSNPVGFRMPKFGKPAQKANVNPTPASINSIEKNQPKS